MIAALVAPLVACGGGGGGGGTTGPTESPAPALVQVENSQASRPQWGLQQAAVVYEYDTEGGISRFSAIYRSTPDGRIGPIRSARLVTIALARLYSAVVVYSGATTYVQAQLDHSVAVHVDETGARGDLFRIDGRPAPGNLVTDGAHLRDLLQHVNAPPVRWALWSRTSSPALAGGRPAARVTVPVSPAETPTFTYDPGAGGWQRTEPDTGLVVDAGSHKPVIAGTVIVQLVQIKEGPEVEDSSGAHGLDITVTGSGQAQIFTAGRAYDATWSQPSSGPPRYTTSDGRPAPIAPGMVWICLVPAGSSASIT